MAAPLGGTAPKALLLEAAEAASLCRCQGFSVVVAVAGARAAGGLTCMHGPVFPMRRIAKRRLRGWVDAVLSSGLLEPWLSTP